LKERGARPGCRRRHVIPPPVVLYQIGAFGLCFALTTALVVATLALLLGLERVPIKSAAR